MRIVVCAVALVGALLAPAAASAASSPHLWATINHCDVAGSSVGIRASMPGNGTSQRMYMRFSAQYRNAAGRFVETGSSTRWIRVGTARTRSVQSGWDFAFAPPPAGSAFTFRGTVGYRWTARKGKRWRVVRTSQTVTRGGVKGVEGSVPKGASAATCTLGR
jgi:hypothetical protein